MNSVVVLFSVIMWLSLPALAQNTASSTQVPFLMPIEDSFNIPGVGPVVVGMIERGRVNKGDKLELVGGTQTKTVTVASIAARSDEGLTAEAGERVDLVIKGASLKELVRGKVLADPKSIKAYTNFKARIDLLETAKGGRSGGVAAGFRPMFMIRSTGFSGIVKTVGGKTVLQPGEKGGEIEIELEIPVALEKGTNFLIRDGSRNIGSGTVTELDR